MPVDLLDRLVIIRTLPYTLAEMVQILAIRAQVGRGGRGAGGGFERSRKVPPPLTCYHGRLGSAASQPAVRTC